MQTKVDADRILAMGARSANVLGNAKFDQAADTVDADPDEVRLSLRLPEDRPIVVVGSTRGEMEEELVLAAIGQVGFDRVAVVHAPRHLESVDALAERVRRKVGSVALRSRQETGAYLILDTYGELAQVYSIADVVIVGGGFENLGGQNIVQPLALGKPVLHGPHMQNFRQSTEMADEAGAAISCRDSASLAASLGDLIADPERRRRMGDIAKNLVQANLGASRRYASAVAEDLKGHLKTGR
jgi:3-deoxy-D-manno-octulosonic-acid transferase